MANLDVYIAVTKISNHGGAGDSEHPGPGRH